jgi:transposase
MAKAFSLDLRERVLADYDLGVGPAELGRKYRVCERWVYKLVKQRQETGSIAPLYGKPGPKPKLEGHFDELRALVEQRPDATLDELRQLLSIQVCLTTVWKALEELRITLKKSPESLRARSA